MVRVAMVRYAAWTVAVLAFLLTASVWTGSHVAREETLKDSRTRSQAIATLVVAPLISTDPSTSQADVAVLDRLMRSRIEDGSIRRVKIWSVDGTILWSDEKSIVGHRFPLDADVSSLFGTENATAEVSSLDKAENSTERGEGPLIEVYAGATAADGNPIVFEAYVPASRIEQDSRTLVAVLLGLSVGVLLLFAAASLPLALSLARRVERAKEKHTRLIRHALLASDLERRRLAECLHDSVLPDLAGIGYLMPVIDQRLGEGNDAEVRRHLDRVREIVSRDMVALRSSLVDIHPPDLVAGGLTPALEELAMEAEAAHGAGLEVRLTAPADLRLPHETSQLTYRVVREGLRNVVKHAHATRSHVSVAVAGSSIEVSIEDNGSGPPVRSTNGGGETNAPEQGHLGLLLLADTMRDLKGVLELTTSGSSGATLRARFPLIVEQA